LSIFIARELWLTHVSIIESQQRITYLTQALKEAKTISQTQNNQLKKGSSTSEAEADEVRTASIELEAEGIKLRMLQEASWSMIMKFCFVWSFALFSLLAYRILDRRFR
jgi:hypothetical protein